MVLPMRRLENERRKRCMEQADRNRWRKSCNERNKAMDKQNVIESAKNSGAYTGAYDTFFHFTDSQLQQFAAAILQMAAEACDWYMYSNHVKDHLLHIAEELTK